MTKFHYQGRNEAGDLIQGEMDAGSPETAAAELFQRKITPIKIEAIKRFPSLIALLNVNITKGSVKLEELITFCRQMYTLIKAGVPITQALTHLLETTRSKILSDALDKMVDEIAGGQTFTSALKQFPNVFPTVFVSIIDAGEQSGQLENAFLQLAQYLELESQTIKRIKSATRYPMLVIIALVIALFVVNFFVVPAFSSMFKGFGGKLPLPTRILMFTSDAFLEYWPILLGIVVVTVIALRYILKTEKGRYFWDKWKLKTPVFGSILRRIILARFTRTFAMIIKTGVPLVQGVNLVANIVGNEFIKQRILQMRDGISRGETLVKTAQDTKLFPALVIQMLSVGEESGSLEEMLTEVAQFYEREVDYDLGRLGDLIEPFLLLIMGSMVLVLALGVFLPMWDMVQFAKM